MLGFREWIQEANLTLSQFMKRVNSNLNAIYNKIKNGDLFQTKDGKPIKLIGLAIREICLRWKKAACRFNELRRI